MNFEEFDSQLSAKNFLIEGENAMGQCGEFPCFISHSNDSSIGVIINAAYDSTDKQLISDIKEALSHENVKKSSIALGFQSISMALSTKDIMGEVPSIFSVIERVTNALSALDIHAPQLCPICQDDVAPDIMGWYDGAYRVLHRQCVDDISAAGAEQAKVVSHTPTLALGLLGAFLGMLVGCIPSILTIIYANGIFSYLFAIIPICVCFGYKKFGGKADITMTIVSVVLSFLGVLFIQFINITLVFISSFSFSIAQSAQMAAEMFFNLGDLWAIIADSPSLLLLVVLALQIFSRTGSTAIHSPETITTTIKDYMRTY